MNLCRNLKINPFSCFLKKEKKLKKETNEKLLEKNSLIFWMNLLNQNNQTPENFLKIFLFSKKKKINENLYIIDKMIQFEDLLFILNKISFKKMLTIIEKIFKENTIIKREIKIFFSYLKFKGFIIEKTFFDNPNELLKKNYDYSFYKIYYHLKESIYYSKKLISYIENDIFGFFSKLKNSKLIFFKEFSDYVFKIIVFISFDLDVIKEIELITLITAEIEKFIILQSNYLLLSDKKSEEDINFYLKNGQDILQFFNQYLLFEKKKDDIKKINNLKYLGKFLVDLKSKTNLNKYTGLSLHNFLQRIKKLEIKLLEKQKSKKSVSPKKTIKKKKSILKSFYRKKSLIEGKKHISSLFKLISKSRNCSPKILKKSYFYKETSKSTIDKKTKCKKKSIFKKLFEDNIE